jgi:hypothetical protein
VERFDQGESPTLEATREHHASGLAIQRAQLYRPNESHESDLAVETKLARALRDPRKEFVLEP